MAQNMALLGLALVVLAVLGLHMLMARKGPVWLGAVMPGLFVTAVVVLIVQGRLEPGRPYVVSLAALVMLLWMWESARMVKSKVEAKEPGAL
jgi:hypothetical protein